jgi:hypothetical protein
MLPGPWQTVRVRVNGLAVRREPSTSAPLVTAYSSNDPAAAPVTDEVRLDDGYFLWIEDGPLLIHGIVWYRVANNILQPGDGMDDVVLWDADGDEFRGDYGWLAGGDGQTLYVEPSEPPPPDPSAPVHGPHPQPWALLHGVGDARSDPFEPGVTPVGIRWYAADPEGETCRITITLMPVGVEMLGSEVDVWSGGDNFWPRDYQTPLLGDHWIEIATDCSWSLRVVPIQG